MRHRDERGAAVVEAAISFPILLFLLFGMVTLVQIMWTHIDLSSAARSATRYAARVEYDPSDPGAPAGERHRTTGEVSDWYSQIIAEAGVNPNDVLTITRPDGTPITNTATLLPGDPIVVTITHRVSNPLYQMIASTADAVGSVFHATPFDPNGVDVKAQATTYVE